MDLLEGVSRSYFRQRREKGVFSFLGGAQLALRACGLWPWPSGIWGGGRTPSATVTVAFTGGVLLYVFSFKLLKQALN